MWEFVDPFHLRLQVQLLPASHSFLFELDQRAPAGGTGQCFLAGDPCRSQHAQGELFSCRTGTELLRSGIGCTTGECKFRRFISFVPLLLARVTSCFPGASESAIGIAPPGGGRGGLQQCHQCDSVQVSSTTK